MVQGKDNARPISIEGQKHSKATVWQAKDVVIRAIHVLRGYNLLSKADGFAGLEDHDIDMLNTFGPAKIDCENFWQPYGVPLPLQIDLASSSKHLVILLIMSSFPFANCTILANRYVSRPVCELLQNLRPLGSRC